MARGRARGGLCLALALVLAGGCAGGGDEGQGGRDVPATDRDDPSESTATTDDGRLARRDYDTGDCVSWDDEDPNDTFGLTPVEVVGCTETHYIQIAAEELAPDWAAYPTFDEWDTYIQDVCRSRASALLGGPLDPYGRFGAGALRPSPESWAEGDRSVWCGVGMPGVADRSRWIPMSEDVRGADQWYHWEVGQCVAFPPVVPANQVVPCDQPHQWEITGRVDYMDQSEAPAGGGDQRCSEPGLAYVGGQPPEPWGFGGEGIADVSWAAGRRSAHCFVGQWNPDGSGPNVVSVSVRG